MTPEPGKAPQVLPLQYETSIADSARPLFRATMGVGITLGIVRLLYLPNVILWYSEVRQVFGSGMRFDYEFAFSLAECAAAVCLLCLSALSLCGRRPWRSWLIALLGAMMCSGCAAQITRYALWECFTAAPKQPPLWTLFGIALALVASFAWPTLMLILVTRPILKPLFRRPVIG